MISRGSTDVPVDLRSLTSSGELARGVLGLNTLSGTGAYLPNPDDLVGRKGLEIYQQMGNDDQVSAVLNLKRNAVLSSRLEFVPATQEPDDLMKCEFIRWNAQNMAGGIHDSLYEILSSFQYGFSVTEKNFRIIDDAPNPKFNGLIGWKSWRTKSPLTFRFAQDQFGGILPNGVVQVNVGAELRLPADKFIIHSHNSFARNPYGRSDCRAAYRSWFSKDWGIKFWNIYLEKFAAPTPVGKVPGNADPAEIRKFQQLIENLQRQTGITIPTDFAIDLLQGNPSTSNLFESMIAMHNVSISRSFLLPDLLGFSGSGAPGSYALGKAQFETFIWVIKQIHKTIEELLLEQAIRQLIDYNFPGTRQYPTAQFQAVTEEGLSARGEIIRLLIENKVVSPNETWIRNFLNIPEPRERIEPVEPEATPEPSTRNLTRAFRKVEPPAKEARRFRRDFTVHERATPFSAILDSHEAMARQIFVRTNPVFSAIKHRVMDKVQSLLRKSSPLAKLDSIKVSLAPLRKVLRNAMFTQALNGRFVALQDLAQRVPDKTTFTRQFADEDEADYELLDEPVDPAVARRFFKGKGLVVGDNTIPVQIGDELYDLYDRRAFTVAKVESESILKEVQAALLKAVKSGDPRRGRQDVASVFSKYIATGDLEKGSFLAPVRLDTIVRTNLMEAYNEARKELYQDADVREFVIGYQWSSVMDDRTTPYCEAMDMQIFRPEQLDGEFPPAHHQCRSTVIPVLSGDEVDYSDLDPREPKAGVTRGAGFAEISRKSARYTTSERVRTSPATPRRRGTSAGGNQ